MVIISDGEMKQLNERRHILIRQFDRGEISFSKYTEEKKILEDKINIIVKRIVNEERVKIKTKCQKEDQKMAEAEKVEKIEKAEKQAKKGMTKRKGSMAAFIEKALCMKSIKNKEQAADKVLELGQASEKQFDRDKVIKQTSAILRDLKKGESNRWKGYTWNAEEYLLTAPEKE